jgi:hypothetical protein
LQKQKHALHKILGLRLLLILKAAKLFLELRPFGDAAQIGGIPTLAAAQMQAVTGQARKTAAADMNAVVGNIPPAITATILDDPQAGRSTIRYRAS